MHLSGLHLYPVKSLRGCSVQAADVDDLGLVGDRRFMVVDESGRFLTQRTRPKMARVETTLSSDRLTLSAPGAGSVSVSRASDSQAAERNASVWKSEGLRTEDCGDEAAAWLTDFLGQRCRLVRAGRNLLRPVLKPDVAGPGDRLAFQDGFPFLAIGEDSLRELNDRIAGQGEDPLPMNRFRPNLVLAGTPPYAEDVWPRFRIGSVLFRAAGPCGRCVVTTTDQETGERGHEPLRTLATFRRDQNDPTEVNFGQNLIHETKHGTLHIGDPVTPA